MVKEEILNKYKDEERILVSRILDKIELSDKNLKIENTDFLNLNEQIVAKNILNKSKRKGIFYGCFEDSERKMLFIIPSKFEKKLDELKINYEDYVGIIRIKLSSKIKEQYSHRNYLGAIIKLGVKREKVGDILVDKEGADIIVSKEILKFLKLNLSGLNRFKECELQEIKIDELKKIEIISKHKTIQVSSMRLDNIVSELANTSRNKSSQIIESQRVFVNYVCETKNTKQIKENDTITIRGKGRFIIKEIVGNTKKGKLNLKIEYFS